jgi:ribosome-associated heat shock protein Hsp15
MSQDKRPNLTKVRIDKWLWAARFFKTRSLAKQAIEGGKIHCDGQRIKASKEITLGLELNIRQGLEEKAVVVTGLSEQRRGAPEAALLYRETDASLALREKRAAERKAGLANYIISDHRPNKKERRQIHRFQRIQGED